MKNKLLAIAALAALTVASCKKDDDNPSRSAMIQGTWKSSFQAADGNNNKTLDASERIAVSDTVSVVTFNSGGAGTLKATGFGNLPITWSLINNDQQIVVGFAGLGSDTSYIHTLTGSELIIEDRSNSSYSWAGFKK